MTKRHMRGVAVLVLGGWLLTVGWAAGQDLPKAETILDRYIEVTGGKAAYEKLTNMVGRGTMEIEGSGIKGPMVAYQAAPNKMYVEIDLKDIGKVEQGTDGVIAWERNAITGARLLTGEEKAAMMRRATFNSDLNWRKIYKKAVTVAEVKVDDKPAYKVELTAPDGHVTTSYYDKASGLVVKIEMTVKSPMGELPTESLVSDYKKVGDIFFPHKMVQKVLVQQITLTVEKVEQNAKIPADRFTPPDEIKKLAEKEKQ